MKLAVGVFIIFFSLLFGSIVYIILDKKGTFEEKFHFHFYTESASSFYTGMPLYFSGFQIGEISNIALTENGKVHVTFEVKQQNHKWICEDTILMLEKPLIGSPSIDVKTSLGYGELEPESILTIIVRDDINDMIKNIDPILSEVETIVSSVNTITTRLADEDGNLHVAVRNLRLFTDKLAHDDSLLTTVTGKKESAEALQKSLDQVVLITEELHAMVKNVNSDIVKPSGGLVKDVETILKDIQQKLAALDGTVKAIGGYDKDLTAIKEEIRLGINKTNQMVEKIDAMLLDKTDKEVTLP
jgi:ABC-type transporter Mla subunit MlaD